MLTAHAYGEHTRGDVLFHAPAKHLVDSHAWPAFLAAHHDPLATTLPMLHPSPYSIAPLGSVRFTVHPFGVQPGVDVFHAPA